jgi:iron complex outermembrane receptor protein
VPAHSGRVWVNYDFDRDVLKGWSVGAGVYAASDQFVDFANVYKTGGYFTVDAKIGYENEKFAASFNVKNLTGEEYFVPYSWLGGQVAPGADRAFYGMLVYKY